LVDLVAVLVQERLVDGIHDVSDGGLAVALAEMAVKSGTGCRVSGISGHQELFGEGPSRVLLSVAPAKLSLVIERVVAAGIPITEIGSAGGHRIVIEGLADFSVDEAVAAWKGALPAIFAAP
jgi:phosphoribosylformylglycinamidine synthase